MGAVRAIAPNTQVDVVAYERPAAAHQLRLAGADWAAVAREVGYADGRIAAVAVGAYLQKIATQLAPERRLEILETELARLDALQLGYWASATTGDIPAALLVLKIIGQRCKLLALGSSAVPAAAGTSATVVIGGCEREYIDGITDFLAAQERDKSSVERHEI